MTGVDPSPDAVEVRALEAHDDYLACVRIQQEVWGHGFADVVPASVLKVSQKIGGVSAGAFDASGRLLGFVFGMSGIEGGRLVHWSHMLAVRPEARNRGIGRRLKAFQRAQLRLRGAETMYWTFDPLVARNAHLNLTRLGAAVVDYVPDMYGSTGSDLHVLGTDRFVVAWPVQGEARPAGPAGPAGATGATGPAWWRAGAPVVNPVEAVAGSARPWVLEPVVGIEIPAEIDVLVESAAELAKRWRATTRQAFLWYLERGYRVVGFQRQAEAGRCFYALAARAPRGG